MCVCVREKNNEKRELLHPTESCYIVVSFYDTLRLIERVKLCKSLHCTFSRNNLIITMCFLIKERSICENAYLIMSVYFMYTT